MTDDIELLSFLNQQTDKEVTIIDVKEMPSHSSAKSIQDKLRGTRNICQAAVSIDNKNGSYCILT